MKSRKRVLVCAGTGCLSCGCRAVRDALMGEVIDLGVASEIEIVETGCFGACDLGPVVIVARSRSFIHAIPRKVRRRLPEGIWQRTSRLMISFTGIIVQERPFGPCQRYLSLYGRRKLCGAIAARLTRFP